MLDNSKTANSLELAVTRALNDVASKISEGLMFPDNHPNLNALVINGVEGVEGDVETIHSIISLYCDDSDNDGTWEAILYKRILEEHPFLIPEINDLVLKYNKTYTKETFDSCKMMVEYGRKHSESFVEWAKNRHVTSSNLSSLLEEYSK